MKESAIYQYSDPREILVFLYQQKKNHNALFSLRAWSKKLGFRNPSLLSDIMNGKRRVTNEFALKISDSLELTTDEKRYFEALVFRANAKSDEERSFFQAALEKFRPQDRGHFFDLGQNPQISHWYYGVLDEMPALQDFKQDYQYLAKRLGPEITPQTIEIALKELLRLGMLKEDDRGNIYRPQKNLYRPQSDEDKPEAPMLRSFRRRFIEKAVSAMEEQPVRESVFKVYNMPIKMKDFPKIRMYLLEDVVDHLTDYEVSKNADEVYCLNLQYFRITQKTERNN
jgi:uncharacterized protein (TIGR02147 family)